jgi:sugar phosphate isomerase/epimerase
MFDFCAKRGIASYSFHTGHYDERATDAESAYDRFVDRLGAVLEAARERGVAIAVETMYPTRNGMRWVLDNETHIRRFLAIDWDVGLVADAAHCHIGVKQRTMSDGLFAELLAHPKLREVHISSNDGVNDIHIPFTSHHPVHAACARVPGDVPIVYEGRMNRWPGEAVRRHVDDVRAWVGRQTPTP